MSTYAATPYTLGLAGESLHIEPARRTSRAQESCSCSRDTSIFMTPEEIASEVNLHRKVIYRVIREGQLPATRLRRRLRIRRSDYEAWLEANRVEPYPVPEIEP